LLNQALRHGNVLGYGCIASRILNLGTTWERAASRLLRFTTEERTPDIHWIGGLMGSRTGLDKVERRKCPALAGNRNPLV